MAGRGPAPSTNRRRSNEPTRGDWIDVKPFEKKEQRVLPTLEEGFVDVFDLEGESITWPAMTRRAWAAWRDDPVTRLYSPADVSYALDTIFLHAMQTNSTANEVRLRMDGLGLTPKGRQDRRVRVADDGLAAAAAPAAKKKKSSSSRRARLELVQ